jgi:hypothetical protein
MARRCAATTALGPLKPAELDWLRFLGRWRIAIGTGMYFSFRLLEFGGKMTDFGHHWMDVDTCIWAARSPRGNVHGRHHYDHHDSRGAGHSTLFEYEVSPWFQSNAYAMAPDTGDILRRQRHVVHESQSLGIYSRGPQWCP